MRMLIRRRWPILVVATAAATVLLLGSGAACAKLGAKEAAAADVQLESVASTGANPFSPPVGTDQPNVTPPAQAGGTFPGDTVGLFGGTVNESSCDPEQLIAFLQTHPDKGAAWATVLGITPADIPTFVRALTPVLLRSDTQVTNHGFENGKATTIPAVLQAGTAVLVDKHGFPVTKCFCGNPLTAPASFTSVRFVGTAWPAFVSSSITIIAPVTVVVNQFTLVVPTTGDSFNRPSGTVGRADGPVTKAPPPPPGAPSNAAPPPSNAAPPPATAAPSSNAPSSAAPSSVAPSSAAPSSAAPSSSGAAPSSAAGPSSGAASPSSSDNRAVPPPPPSAQSRASWVVGDCYVASSQAHAVVLLRNEGTGPAQTYTVTVHLGPSGPVSLDQQVQVSSAPGQIGTATVNAPASGAPDAKLPCTIVSVKDGSGATPTLVGPLPPPPDTRPTPASTTPSRTSAPPTSASPTSAPPTSAPATTAPRTSAPATTAPRTSAPPTSVPRTSSLPTDEPIPDES